MRRLLRLLLGVLVAGGLLVLVVALFGWRGELPPSVAHRVYPLSYESEIAESAERHGLDPYLIAAVVKAESNFRPEAVSRAGAVGLMQLMPATAGWITERPDWEGSKDPRLTDPGDNVQLGSYYLAYLVRRFGDEPTALAAYNAGHGNVEGWLRAKGEDEAAASVTVGDIPFQETRDFVERVERFRELYQKAHPDAFQSAGS